MAGKQKINLDPNEQKKLIKMYTDALQELAQDTGSLIKKLQALQQKEKYKVINDITDAALIFYVQDLKNIMTKNYETWYNSEVSMHRIIEGSMSGENAVNTAQKLEGNIASAIIDMFAAPPSPLSVDDSNPNIEPEKLKELEEHIKSYLKKVSEAQKKYVGKIDKDSEANQLFSCIRGHVNATYQGAFSGFHARAGQVAGISEELRTAMKNQESALEALNATISKTSEALGANTDSFPKVDFF